MRIPKFGTFIEMRELNRRTLHDSTVVIDGDNYFYTSYQESQLPSHHGCESHRYANYLRKELAIFKKANIKCYFIFRGGHQNTAKRLQQVRDCKIIRPVFMTSICMEVLKEMAIEYVICEYGSKRDIIEIAQTLNCPIISYDIEFCFSGVEYIPKNELKFNEKDSSINCRYFLLDNFLSKYKLTADKIAFFIVLTDEEIFPEGFFLDFFLHMHLTSGCYERYSILLHWLSVKKRDLIIDMVSQFVKAEEKTRFVEEVVKAQLQIRRREKGGLGAACLLDPTAAVVKPGDPNWFAKGVALEHISINYINLYHFKYIFGSLNALMSDPMIPSLEIVKYAYDLLTNFQNDWFTLLYDTHTRRESLIVSELYSIRKPEYEANVCVFENGWGSVRELGLFQHFLKESLQLTSLEPLAELPEDARLLVVALVYFSRKIPADMSTEIACVLLSYITLSTVLKKSEGFFPMYPFSSKPILKSTTDKSTVTDDDCYIAAAILEEYLDISKGVVVDDLDEEIMNHLKEFQICLRELNDLNVLCGAPLPPTVYSETYSGTLVARLRCAAGFGDSKQFFDKLLAPAPTVYALLNGLIESYQAL